MSGKRAKDLRGHGKALKQNPGLAPSPGRLNLLQTASLLTAKLQEQVRGRKYYHLHAQYVSTYRCAYRKVKALYTQHRARTGKSL